MSLNLAVLPILSSAARSRLSTQPATHPLVIDWVNRVVANNGQQPSAKTVSALNTFVNNLSNIGLLSRFTLLNPIVPDNLVAALTPLIYTNGATLPPENVLSTKFENSLEGWTTNGAAVSFLSDGWDGASVAISHYPGERAYLTTFKALSVGHRYRLTLYFRNKGSRGQVKIGTAVNDGSIYLGPELTNTVWERKLIHFTATVPTVYITLYNVDSGIAQTNWDEVRLDAVTSDEVWTYGGFVPGDLNEDGLKGGTGRWARTGFLATMCPYQDIGASVFSTEANTTSYGVEIGYYAFSKGLMLQQSKGDGTSWAWFPEYVTVPKYNNGVGWFSGNRLGNGGSIYAGDLSGTFTTRWSDLESSSFSNQFAPYVVYAWTGGDASGNPNSSLTSTARIAFIAVHDYFNATDSQKLYQAVLTLRAALKTSGFDSGTLNELGNVVVSEQGNVVI